MPKGSRPTDPDAKADSGPAALVSELDFEDVGPTEVQNELDEVPLDDLPFYEPFKSGQKIGRYRIERTLGRGATGVVVL